MSVAHDWTRISGTALWQQHRWRMISISSQTVMDDPLAALDHIAGSALLQAIRQYIDTPGPGGRQHAVVIVLSQTHLLASFDHACGWMKVECRRRARLKTWPRRWA